MAAAASGEAVVPDDDAPLRVLRLLTRANLGGPTRQAIALWHAHRAQGVETLLVTGSVAAGEVELSPVAAGDIPALTPAQVAVGGGGVVVLPRLGRALSPLRDRRVARDLGELMRRFRPHVVHTHTSKAGVLGRRAARRAGVPVVAHTFHGHVLRDYFSWPVAAWLRRLERRLAGATDLLFSVSNSCADELAQLGVAPRERFRVLPPAVALAPPAGRAEARRQLGVAADAHCVAAVGRLVPIKRLHHLAEVVAALPELRCDVFGDGPGRAALAVTAEKTGGRLRLCPPRQDVHRWLAAYDALLLPSVREGLPLVAIEAFAAGVPVVGYDVPGVRDAIDGLGDGVLVDERDGPAGLARALAALSRQPERCAAVVMRAREAVAACRPDRVAAQLLMAYRQALARGRG